MTESLQFTGYSLQKGKGLSANCPLSTVYSKSEMASC